MHYNVCLKLGEDNFLKECKNVGIDGLIISDLPYPENIPFVKKCRIPYMFLKEKGNFC